MDPGWIGVGFMLGVVATLGVIILYSMWERDL